MSLQIEALHKNTENMRQAEQAALSMLANMTLQDKLGQLCQQTSFSEEQFETLIEKVKKGQIGSVINEVNPDKINQLQQAAVENSPLGIPLLIGRDVIHGFKTIFPIPLGQAASWCQASVKNAARIAAMEASHVGINWTFAPMIDISRDPRWGRIAESLGEDPFLCSVLGVAMVDGFQSEDLAGPNTLAACAKHFAGYGACESGRDYSTTNIPENELRNVYLPPFKAAADAGVATFMASFSDLNGVPASGNPWLMDQVLRQEWHYSGFVVSDWESIHQLEIHGVSEDQQDSAKQAITAGIDMEMVSQTYAKHLPELLTQGKIAMSVVDASVLRILKIKFALGLFEKPYQQASPLPQTLNPGHLDAAKQLAIKSCVLLKNDQQRLPLCQSKLSQIAVIGPLADDGYEQLGTWVFDGEEQHSLTCLNSIQTYLHGSRTQLRYHRGLPTSRSHDVSALHDVIEMTAASDVALLFLGEESILSGEAHCRAEIDLPGAQHELIEAVAQTGTPIVLVIMAGRPLTLEPIIDKVDSILYAWHPGTMGGPAITDLLFGEASPSGRLPVTFPRKVGQIPLYYAQKHSGKPATAESFVHMDDIKPRAAQTSLGMAATHLDTHYSALFPFGFGLTYSSVDYKDLAVSQACYAMQEQVEVSVNVTNTGKHAVLETVQLYIRDNVASVTRPVKELKGFQQVALQAGQSKQVIFNLSSQDLAFYGRDMQLVTEPGRFQAWIGGNALSQLTTSFELTAQV